MKDRKSVLLLMYRKVLAEFVVKQLRETADLKVTAEYDYQNGKVAADIVKPDLIFLEVPESGNVNAEICLELCRDLKQADRNQKILLLVSEKEADVENLMIRCMKEKLADDFIFHDTSMKYLIAKIRSMM